MSEVHYLGELDHRCSSPYVVSLCDFAYYVFG